MINQNLRWRKGEHGHVILQYTRYNVVLGAMEWVDVYIEGDEKYNDFANDKNISKN